MSELHTTTPETSALSSIAANFFPCPLVLIADADADSRLRRAQQLADRGFRVAVARTAFEAIVKASCHLPNLILVDASLGDEDAAGTARLLATCPATAHIPVMELQPGGNLPARLGFPNEARDPNRPLGS